jgi:hypothetical protein
MDPQPEATKTMIELRKVSKWFDKFQALKEVSLTVRKGERMVICGPSSFSCPAVNRSSQVSSPVNVAPHLGQAAGTVRLSCSARPTGYQGQSTASRSVAASIGPP